MNVAIQNAAANHMDLGRAATHSHVCTLFEGSYHLGLAALTNSLVANGFRGTIWAGYRGAPPPWAEGNKHVVNDTVVLEFILLDVDIHLTNYKPQFMLELIRSGKVDSGYLWYFDPDIVVDVAWEFYASWGRGGVALVQDLNNEFPANHPARATWNEQAGRIGLGEPKPIGKYYNAGFIGVPCSATVTLELWQNFIELASQNGMSLHHFLPGTRANAFYMPDQDGLNAALMYDKASHSTMGPEAMAFVPGYAPMAHAIGRPKPWEGCKTLHALKGFRPSKAQKTFYKYCDAPIPVFSPLVNKARKLDLIVASMIGRFYGRA
jgi:hypothetical protein